MNKCINTKCGRHSETTENGCNYYNDYGVFKCKDVIAGNEPPQLPKDSVENVDKRIHICQSCFVVTENILLEEHIKLKKSIERLKVQNSKLQSQITRVWSVLDE